MIAGRGFLSNQDSAILRDAAQLVIETLKDQHMRDPDRQTAISRVLTGKPSYLSTEQYSQMVQLGKGLDDYDDHNQQGVEDDTNVEDEMGVAVVFDESDDDDGGSDGEDVVADVAGSSSDEDDSDNEGPAPAKPDDNSDDDRVVQGGGDDKKKQSHGSDRLLSVHEIDAHFLQRQLSKYVPDADVCAKIASDVHEVLRTTSDLRECENKLLVLLGFEAFDTIKLLLNNRVKVWACISMKKAQNDQQREDVENAIQIDAEGRRVWEELHSKSKAEDWTRERMREVTDSFRGEKDVTNALDSIGIKPESQGDNMEVDIVQEEGATELDLETLAFRDGSHTMSNKKCNLPDNSWRAMKKGYEEVHVPAVSSIIPKDEKLVLISELPEWTHAAFKGMDKLNRVQSKLAPVALESSENILLCAPTGAGKTNVAMLTMLNILGQYRKEPRAGEEDDDDIDGQRKAVFDLNKFKIVYVAPMKALVQEVVKNFSKRLEEYGVVVRELSGDSSLTRQQIAETQLLVTTPEKFDIVTRQGEGRAYTQLVKLVIIDEIHLLHDDRGPVLESIVARIIRQVETNAEPVRLVGLSATLPNYADVATFLRVKPDKGLFFFDHSFRPVPLQMQYIGITERNAFKRMQLQNEICYEKALTQRRQGNQMLIFVHSRAETGKTAKAIRDLALDRDELTNFVRDGGATQEILKEESASVKNADLKDVLQHGFAIHHAGMAREDRELVEDLFADRHIAVLCTTATLAWGVNLPAHAVIIKGTEIYDPTKGRWAELSPLDVLQMLGRAGRPQYDSEGEGIIMTKHSELQYYLSLTNLQLPVESQLIKTLPDHLNAEVVLGTIQSIDEAVEWLSYTFLYIRMLQNPGFYGIVNSDKTLAEDPTLKRRRLDLAHTAAALLEKSHLVRYDRKSGSLQSTPLGRVSSQYYISHSSMAQYSRHMRPNMTDIELLRLFAMSGEFAHITVREEEKLELAKLAGKVPIPVKESPSEPSAKVNILLQAYISRLKLEGFALVSDMAFIQQSAARIMRALFEIALRRNWAGLAKLTLSFANMVTYRIWRSQTPLRQFKNVPEIVARKLERKSDIEWARYADLTPSDLGELVGVPKMGRVLHKLVHQFPRLELSAHIQPITRSILRVELTLIAAFEFDINVHGYVQLFHVIVEDVNGEQILHHEMYSLKSRNDDEEHSLVFTVPVMEPLPPVYFIRVIADRWLHSESVLPISFSKTILPAKFPPPTELLDLRPLPISAIGESALSKLFLYKEFNPIQTQTFHELFKTDRNVLICAPSGSGKNTLAEFAILRMLVSNPGGKCVYVAPSEQIAQPVFENWKRRFGGIIGTASVVKLSGETSPDLTLLTSGKIIVATVKQWDVLSRRWRQRKAVSAVALVIFDELHFLGGDIGPTMEVVISRMRYISSQAEGDTKMRIVGLSASLANAREVGEWMGVSSKSLFNFSPKVRPIPLEIYFQSFDQSNFSARLMAMAKPVYNAIIQHSEFKPVIVFVPSRKQAQLTAIDLMTYHENQGDSRFLGGNTNPLEIESAVSELRDSALQHVIMSGIGFVHDGMVEADWDTVTRLYGNGTLRVLVCPVDLCWKLGCLAHLVVIMGTEGYDGRERRHVDYPIVDLLHMMGRATRQDLDKNGKCVILCHHPKKEYLKKLLYDPLPIESHLDHYLHDHFNSEIVTKTIGSMQDAVDYITWTFLYRRLAKNPNYYGLQGTSNVHLSEHLSEMVETVLGDLEESKCCQMSDEGDVTPLNLGMIAAYYYIQYTTTELIASSVTEKTKIRGVMEILAAASEFSSLPVRFGEEKALKILARSLTHKLPDSAQFYDSNTKALVLLQCHFSRIALSSDLRTDLGAVLRGSVPLIQAIVDVISSNGWLKPALAAMELSQMVVQGLWNKDHVLKQIPHFTDEIISRCVAFKGEEAIESVFDILTLDDDTRNGLLRLSDEKMADVAVFCNNYPNIEITFEVQDPENVSAGEPVQIAISLEREIEDEADEDEIVQLGEVSAPLFPVAKQEGWWISIGDTSTNSLLSLKRVSLKHKQRVVLEFMAPDEAGDHSLTLFCMSDSYLGCDQEYAIPLSVAVGSDDDEGSDVDDHEES
jgi:pre-mRNA-splicing helicase BRR2